MTQKEKDFIISLLAEFVRHDAWTWRGMCQNLTAEIDWYAAPLIVWGNGITENRKAVVLLKNGKRQEVGCGMGAYWMKGLP